MDLKALALSLCLFALVAQPQPPVATQKLYVASHIFSINAVPTASNWGRLFRYSYSSASKTYALDAGFPVDITRGNAEALTIAKDSLGRIWATWCQSSQVMINHSIGSDTEWDLPSVLPASPESVSLDPDDIVEVPALVHGGGVSPLAVGQLPRSAIGLITQTKEYERELVEAAVTGDAGLAALALAVHPLVPGVTVAREMISEYRERHGPHLAYLS